MDLSVLTVSESLEDIKIRVQQIEDNYYLHRDFKSFDQELENLMKLQILNNNIPAMKLVIKPYYDICEHPNYSKMLKIAISGANIETILHIYDRYYCNGPTHFPNELEYSKFLNLSKNNPDPRVLKFVSDMEEFIVESDFSNKIIVPDYPKWWVNEKITNNDPEIIKWQKMVDNASNYIVRVKSAHKK